MIVEALLVSLIISIGLFLSEFFKMRNVFESVFKYNQFFSGFGMNRFRTFDTLSRKEGDIGSRFSGMEKKFCGIEDRLSRQENVLEKIIREMSGVNA